MAGGGPIGGWPAVHRHGARQLATLGVHCALVEATAGHDGSADGIDDELREVFLDEAGELLPEIERHWLRWRADNQQREALGEVRRALHTLKGSGRMVHAEAVAELAGAPSTC